MLERLASFAGVVHTLVALAAERQATVVLALPNDAAGSDAAAGGRRSVWSEGAVAELRGLLPDDHVAFDLVALRGAALVPRGRLGRARGVRSTPPRAPSPRPRFVLAFGPRAPRLTAAAAVGAADLSAERAHERARTAELEVLRARARRARRPTAARARQRRPGARERGVKVAFLVNDLQLSGGVGVVVAHARQLHDRHGFDVTLVLAREQEDPHWSHEPLEGLPVVSLDEARGERYDIAVSTWWETAFSLFELRAERYASFVQSLEDRFYRPDEADRLGARLVLDLPVTLHHRGALDRRHACGTCGPSAPCHLVRNGIDKRVFAPPARLEPRVDGPLRVLVEGNADVWFKGVNEAVAAVGADAASPTRSLSSRPTAPAWLPTAPTASSARSRSASWRRSTPRATCWSSCRASRGCTGRRSRPSTWARRA